MNAAFTRFACLAVLTAAATAAAAPPDRFDRTKARIDALLEKRQQVPPLPAKSPNPFLFIPPGTIIAPPPGSAADKAPPVDSVAAALTDDSEILAFCIARLRITGQVLRNGIAHLLINASTYREGDLIPVRGSGDTIYYVKVVSVAATEVVFGYNEAVLTVPLRG